MSGKTYKSRAVVLKKTKLAERDLIVTMVDEAGSLVKGVAKGARRPGGSLAAKLELFSTVDALLARGRSLDVLCDVRLDTAGGLRPFGLEQAACASSVAELVCSIAQPDLPQRRLFDMTTASFARIRDSAPPDALALCAASLWKVMAQSGFRPRFDSCAICGKPASTLGRTLPLSFSEGGVVCGECARPADAVATDKRELDWCAFLLNGTFDDIEDAHVGIDVSCSALQLVGQWIVVHTGRNLKSLDFLLSSGLF